MSESRKRTSRSISEDMVGHKVMCYIANGCLCYRIRMVKLQTMDMTMTVICLGNQAGKRIQSAPSFSRCCLICSPPCQLTGSKARSESNRPTRISAQKAATSESCVDHVSMDDDSDSQIRDLEARVEMLSGTKDETYAHMREIIRGKFYSFQSGSLN